MGDIIKAWIRDGHCNCPVQWHEEVSKACSSFPEPCNALPGSMLPITAAAGVQDQGRKKASNVGLLTSL